MQKVILSLAILLSAAVVGTTTANAMTYFYTINAFYKGQPAGPTNSITGLFRMDDEVGPLSITDIDIYATLPTTAGPFSFRFDQVINPVDTWNAFGGTSPYLWFANTAFSAGDTHFWMGMKYDTNADDGSYLIGIWGRQGNPHPSEISVLNVNFWQGIEGRVMREITSSVPEPSTWAMLLIGFAGIGFATYARASGMRYSQNLQTVSRSRVALDAGVVG